MDTEIRCPLCGATEKFYAMDDGQYMCLAGDCDFMGQLPAEPLEEPESTEDWMAKQYMEESKKTVNEIQEEEELGVLTKEVQQEMDELEADIPEIVAEKPKKKAKLSSLPVKYDIAFLKSIKKYCQSHTISQRQFIKSCIETGMCVDAKTSPPKRRSWVKQIFGGDK
jgi:hypothetical protein